MTIDAPHVCQHCGGDVAFGKPTDRDYRDFYHLRSGTADCPPPVDFARFAVVTNGDIDDPPALRCRFCLNMVSRLPQGARVLTLSDLIAEATQHFDHHCTYQGG